MKKICFNCKHWNPDETTWKVECKLMDYFIEHKDYVHNRAIAEKDSFILVGPNFGCIHWDKDKTYDN